MKKNRNAGLVAAGFLADIIIGAPTAQAAVDYLQAYPNWNKIDLCGWPTDVAGGVYYRGYQLRQATGYRSGVRFNVYWDDAVRIDTTFICMAITFSCTFLLD